MSLRHQNWMLLSLAGLIAATAILCHKPWKIAGPTTGFSARSNTAVESLVLPQVANVRPESHPPKSAALAVPATSQPSAVARNLLDTTNTAIREFHAWAHRYVEEVDPVARYALVEPGQQLALAHREAIKRLIPNDPRSALRQAVPLVLRQQLPPEVVTNLEERINIRAFFGVYATAPGDSDPIRRVIETPGKRYTAYVYGRRLARPTRELDYLVGITVGDLMAVDERPLRVLETGEKPDPAKPLLKASPKGMEQLPAAGTPQVHSHTAAPFGDKSPLVEAGGRFYQLCCTGHLIQFERELFAFEGGTGGPVYPSYPILTTSGTGVRSVLYLRVAFPDVLLEPQTEAAAYDMMNQVNAWFVESSYGNLYLLSTVAPLIVLPRIEAWYQNNGSVYDLRDDAVAIAKTLGYDGDSYNHIVFAFSGGPGNFQGLGTVAGKHVWLKSINFGTAAHELAHNFGLWHANSWETAGQSVIGEGSNLEYGNIYDTMGGSDPVKGHFNVAWKNQLGWLGDEFVHTVGQSGTYRLFAFDQSRLDPAQRYGLRIRKDSERSYWAEFRQQLFSSSPWLQDGVLLNWSPWTKSGGGTQLLDTTPASPDGKNDSALTIGRTFSDFESGLHITPVGKGGTTPESIDLVVNFGTFPSNQPPTVIVSADQTNVAAGVAVIFTATATDPEGDALAYFWDFGDKTYSKTNSFGATKSWSSPGEYVVRCLVSDMKGGTASDSVIVRVGSPTTFAISGRIISSGQPLANVHVHNGRSASSYRGAYTDSDGTFRIAGLTAGNVTLSAVLYGYSFTASFANPVTVGPDFTGANFTAQETVRVSISATDQTATEGSDTATITLTRSGSTASLLKVIMGGIDGTAQESEYTIAPGFVYDTSIFEFVFTIPAGQAALNLIITPVSDGVFEGPETSTIEIKSAASYNIFGANSATVTIFDNGSTLPLVSVEATDADASETGNSATFRVSRLGSTNNPLTVHFNLSGSAVNGIDYATIATNVVIPAGQSSTIILIHPFNDPTIEGVEIATLTLATNANYVLSASTSEASAFVVDDDTPTVSIVATDATASEAGQDPAIFVIMRTGDTGAPLIVNYALAGSAQHGVDYAILPGVLTIPAGSSAGSITVVPIDDSIGEPVQTIVVQLRGGNGYAVGNLSDASASIADNDVPVVTIGVSDATFGEPGSTGQFKFNTTGSGGGNITVHYTVTGTATPGVDYMALPGTLSMGKNTTATVTVTPLDDTALESLETVTVTIDPDSAYTIFLDRDATLNLLDNEQNIVDVAPGRGFLSEGVGDTMQFYISRKGSAVNALIVNYLMSGTASNGLDYQMLPGTATVAAGQSGVSVDAAIIDDALAEGTEAVILTLTTNAAYGLGIPSATLFISDAQVPQILVGFNSAAGSGSENVGVVNIPVSLNRTSASPVTVEYAIAGGSATGGVDYNLTAGILTFTPGGTATNIPLTIIDDSFDEPAQTVIITLKNPWHAALGSNTYTYTINDNDNPPPVTIGFAASASGAGENASPTVLLVSLTTTQAVPVAVHYAPSGGTATGGGIDYTLSPGTLTFAPGETVKSIPIVITGDLLNEPNETLIVTLDSPSGVLLNANTTHILTISNLSQTVPEITGHPQSQTVVSGGNVTLSVVVTPAQLQNYQWFFNSIAIPGAISPSYTRSNFLEAAEGRYHVVVTNLAGSATSQPAVLYLDLPLRFTDPQFTSNGFFHVQLIGSAASNRVILASTDLTNWTSLSTNNNSNGIISFTDTNSLGLGARFYRAKTTP